MTDDIPPAAESEVRAEARPVERPGRLAVSDWKDLARRVRQEISADNIFLVSGGVAYYMLLALFPALIALVSIYGLVLNPAEVERQVGGLSRVLPPQSRQLLLLELHRIVSLSSGSLGVGLVFGVLFALWSTSRGVSGLITGITIAYERQEKRGFLRFNLIALLLTVGAIAGGLVAVALVAVLPAAAQAIGAASVLKWLTLILRWPLLIGLVLAGLAVLYRYGPDRDTPEWRWLSPGALVATALWIAGSIGLSVYVSYFSSYNKTYGSLTGVVLLLTWMYLSIFVVLLGAAINGQAERQARARGAAPAAEPAAGSPRERPGRQTKA